MPISVLLVQPPPALHAAILERLTGMEGLSVVGTTVAPVETLVAIKSLAPDLVIMGMADRELPVLASSIVEEFCDVAVLAVSGDGRYALLYEMTPRLVAMADFSMEHLGDIIKRAVGAEVG